MRGACEMAARWVARSGRLHHKPERTRENNKTHRRADYRSRVPARSSSMAAATRARPHSCSTVSPAPSRDFAGPFLAPTGRRTRRSVGAAAAAAQQ